MIQNVFADYKGLRDSGKLSTEDKTRLEASFLYKGPVLG